MDESKLINDNDLLKPRAGDAFPYLAQAILSALGNFMKVAVIFSNLQIMADPTGR
jgi:hypothetical protein